MGVMHSNSLQACSVLGKHTVPSSPEDIENDVGQISVDYGKLKNFGYCDEYSKKDLFVEVQYFLFCTAAGNAVEVIKPINLLAKVSPTLPLDKDYDCHIQRAVVDIM